MCIIHTGGGPGYERGGFRTSKSLIKSLLRSSASLCACNVIQSEYLVIFASIFLIVISEVMPLSFRSVQSLRYYQRIEN